MINHLQFRVNPYYGYSRGGYMKKSKRFY